MKTISKSPEVYNKCRNKMYENSSTATGEDKGIISYPTKSNRVSVKGDPDEPKMYILSPKAITISRQKVIAKLTMFLYLCLELHCVTVTLQGITQLT